MKYYKDTDGDIWIFVEHKNPAWFNKRLNRWVTTISNPSFGEVHNVHGLKEITKEEAFIETL